MIISHERRIIFIKTKKTAGTSFEIALSRFCGSACIITPITSTDEETRRSLGFRTAQNHESYHWKDYGITSAGSFYNHIPANRVRSCIPTEVWESYKKITIVRNPFDVAISRYYWEGGESNGDSFVDFLKNHPQKIRENFKIAPLSGPSKLDIYLRYESLEKDFHDNGLGFLWETFSKIRAKGDKRPKDGTSIAEIYGKCPQAAQLVKESCGAEIALLGYSL